MKNQTTQVLQKSLSKAFPGNRAELLAEAFILLLTGMLAMVLHAKLRIPMHLPGKQGLLFMFIVISSSLLSRVRFSTLLVTTGAASLLLTGFGGFDDPLMPVYYLSVGFVMDLFLISSPRFLQKAWLIGLAGGLSFSLIPVSRALISIFTGLPYPSLFTGILYPWITHFLFGFVGSFLAAMAVKTLAESEKK
ncbi:MAG TPA: hypothetical protein VF298_01280 [Bacteroidales bacterium]